MPTARASFGVGVVNDVLYAIGGTSGSSCPGLANVEAYDPASDTWTTKANMLTPRGNIGVGVVDGLVYAIDGQAGCGGDTTAVEAYDPASDSWTSRASSLTTHILPSSA
jgi:kelch-like protein 2/3